MNRSNIHFVEAPAGQLTFIGNQRRCGSYILRIRLAKPATIAFGRFRGGKLVRLEPGDYAYVGSAMSDIGSSCLARRLLRHATRMGQRLPHPLRQMMLSDFPGRGLCEPGLLPPSVKLPRWNVDHLLDLPNADLVGVYLLRSDVRLEAELGRLIAGDPAAVVFETGLGANDIPGNTHLVRIEAGEQWWQQLPKRLARFLNEQMVV